MHGTNEEYLEVFSYLEITTFGKYIHQHVRINSNSKLPTKAKDPNFTNNETHDATIFCVISCCLIQDCKYN
jgi:hypothetical protein